MGVSLPTMTPPNKPPDKDSKGLPRAPGKRLPFWLRQSDSHPMVQSQPDEIVKGTHAFMENIRRLCSPSPPAGGQEFSRFSSQAATPDAMAHGTPSRYPVYSYPPPPPPLPRPFPLSALPSSTRQEVPYTPRSQLPPSSPLRNNSRGQQGEYLGIVYYAN